MAERKNVYGASTFESVEVEDANAKAMYEFLKGHEAFEEGHIGFFRHKDGNFILDANAVVTTAYKKDEDGKFYMGFDGWYALINDVEGIKEFMEVEGL
jgi:hypothetical protein